MEEQTCIARRIHSANVRPTTTKKSFSKALTKPAASRERKSACNTEERASGIQYAGVGGLPGVLVRHVRWEMRMFIHAENPTISFKYDS